jgi:signal transduction histidine kinase
MKQDKNEFSKQYVASLRRHLKQGAGAKFQSALKLGRQAVALGLETLEMARIHDQAVASLELTRNKSGIIKWAENFFSEAITPIVETHHAARQTQIQLTQLTETLNRRTKELADTNLQVKSGIIERKSAEAALKETGEHFSTLLKEALELQEGLRHLTHQAIASQEDERATISRELQNEIAQTLLGINVRLLSVKREAKWKTENLKNEIASTQRMVVKTVQSVRRVAREVGSA